METNKKRRKSAFGDHLSKFLINFSEAIKTSEKCLASLDSRKIYLLFYFNYLITSVSVIVQR